MKAVMVTSHGGPEVLKYMTTDIPEMAANQVLIKVSATSVNFADIMARQGKYHNAKQPPFIPGLDAAGVIEAVGSEVKDLKIGQRVIAFTKNGSYAEYVVADQDLVFVLPENVDFDTAAACPIISFTSYKLLADVARVQPGETVVIHAAAGGIGTTAIQLAKILGAGCVIGTVGNEKKIEIAKDAGADHVICYERENFVEKVKDLTNGQGAAVILDSISGDVAEKSLECLAFYGRLVNFGAASGNVGQFKTVDLHSSCRSVLGFSIGTTINKRPQLLRDTAEHILRYLDEGKLKMKIGKQFMLVDAPEAHHFVESRRSTGKILLKV